MRKLKPKYEAFCRSYVDHANAGEAALAAGYAHLNRYHQGAELLARPQIVARIREMRSALAQRESLHVESLLAKLEVAYGQALHQKNTLAAVRVIELQAKLAGFVGPRRDERGEKIADVLAEADALLASADSATSLPHKPSVKPRAKPPARRAIAAPPDAVAPDLLLPGAVAPDAMMPDAITPDAKSNDAKINDAKTNDNVATIGADELPVSPAPAGLDPVAPDLSASEPAEAPTMYAGPSDEVRRAALLAVARARTRKRLKVR